MIIEPFRDNGPENGYLKVKSLSKKYGAVLIFDEVTSGFRETLGGMYKKLMLFLIWLLLVKLFLMVYQCLHYLVKNIMKSFQSTFISSTYWGDRTGPAAALATIDFMKKIM